MNPTWTDEETAFRQEVRDFLAAELPSDLRAKVLAHEDLAKADFVRWLRILHGKGWVGATWPKEYGGPGWSRVQVHIFDEECWLAGAPEIFAFGPKLLGPVLIRFGDEDQKARLLPRILNGEDWWCQGYSEPGSGSDLASLKTSAVLDGDHFIVNGQKTWTTNAHYASKMFCLVRTDLAGPPQRGISFLLIDMDMPGITVRPITLLDGTQEVSEVFFDDVRVPRANLVGELNKGWVYAKALLGDERLNAGKIGRTKRELALLKSVAGQSHDGRPPMIADLRFAEKVAQVEIDTLALEYMALRLIANAMASGEVGVEASLLKLRGTEIAQSISALLIDAIGAGFDRPAFLGSGPQAPVSRNLTRQYLNWRKLTIYGGTNEVQRNIIAKAALGL